MKGEAKNSKEPAPVKKPVTAKKVGKTALALVPKNKQRIKPSSDDEKESKTRKKKTKQKLVRTRKIRMRSSS